MLIEAGLVALSNAVSSSRTKSQNKFSTAALRNFHRFLPAIFTAFRRSLLLDSARRRLFISSLCCHAAYNSASTPGFVHQFRALRGRLEHGASSVAMDRRLIRCVNGRRPPSEAPEPDHNLVYANVRIRCRSARNRRKRDSTEDPKTTDPRWMMADPNL